MQQLNYQSFIVNVILRKKCTYLDFYWPVFRTIKTPNTDTFHRVRVSSNSYQASLVSLSLLQSCDWKVFVIIAEVFRGCQPSVTFGGILQLTFLPLPLPYSNIDTIRIKYVALKTCIGKLLANLM